MGLLRVASLMRKVFSNEAQVIPSVVGVRSVNWLGFVIGLTLQVLRVFIHIMISLMAVG